MCFHEIKNLGKSIKESGVVPSTGREQKTVLLLGDVHTLALSYVSNITWQSKNAFFFYKQEKMEGSDLQFFLGQSIVMACLLSSRDKPCPRISGLTTC